MRIVGLLLLVAVVIAVIWMRAKRRDARSQRSTGSGECADAHRARPGRVGQLALAGARWHDVSLHAACRAARRASATQLDRARAAVAVSRRARPRVRSQRRAVRRQRRRSQHLSRRYRDGRGRDASSARPKAWPTTSCFSPTARSCGPSISAGRRARAQRRRADHASSPKLVSVNSINVRKRRPAVRGAGVRRRRRLGARSRRARSRRGSILKDPGGFNGFDIGPDGKLYGPLWFKHQVVRIDPDSGELNVDRRRVRHARRRELRFEVESLRARHGARRSRARRHPQPAAKQVVAQLATALDNLAIDSQRSRCSSRTWPTTASRKSTCAQARRARSSKARSRCRSASPRLPMATRDTLYVADVFAFRSVDAAAGQGRPTSHARMRPDTPIGYPVAVTANQRHVIVTNNEGPVQRYERSTMRLVQSWRDTHAGNAIEMPSGALIVAETTRGKLSRIAGSGEGEQRCARSSPISPRRSGSHSPATTRSMSAKWRPAASRAST